MTSLQKSKTPCTGDTKSVARLFNLLENESKERVLRFLTNFRTLSPLEKAAAAEELGVVFPKEAEECALRKRPLQGPALAVRARDPSYVCLAGKTPAGAVQAAGDAPLAISNAAEEEEENQRRATRMTALVHGSLIGGEPLPLLREPSPGGHGASTDAADGAGIEQEAQVPDPRLDNSLQGSEIHSETTGSIVPDDAAVLYRSRGYQARRLARGDEAPEVAVPYTPVALMNLTGMPIDADDMRKWFELLDLEGRGELGVVPFLQAIDALERDFGVSVKAKAEFKAEVEALAKDELLTFEKFAYFVSRFARH